MVQYRMLKADAIKLLGGTTASAAEAIGVTYQAVGKWPDELPPRIADRVLAALARKHLSLDQLGAPMTEKAAEGPAARGERRITPNEVHIGGRRATDKPNHKRG